MRPRLCLFLALVFFPVAIAQQPPSLDSKISAILVRMKGKNLLVREKAYDDLMEVLASEREHAPAGTSANVFSNLASQHPDQSDRVRLALIQLLEWENELFISPKDVEHSHYTERDSEHYADLITTVSIMYDERAIPALVGAMTTGGIATRGLLYFGDKALDPITEQLKSPNTLVRSSALALSISLLEDRKDPASHKRAMDLIRLYLNDSDAVVRNEAVRDVECVGERREFVSALEQIAKTDSFKLPGKALDGGDGEEFYPVRYSARRVLRDIKDNKTCNQ